MKMMFDKIIVLLTILILYVHCDDQIEVKMSKTMKACKQWQSMEKTTGVMYGEVPERDEFMSTGVLGVYVQNDFQPFKFKCAAHLISHKFLLTAGHCADKNLLRKPLFVRFTLNYQDPKGYWIDYSIKNVTLAPNYKYSPEFNSSYDLALLELESDVEFNSMVKPACLITEDMQFDYSQYELYFAGYGLGYFSSDGGMVSPNKTTEYEISKGPLRKLQVKVNERKAPAELKVTPVGAGTTCNGDSGGSIEVEMFTRVNIIIGILSKGGSQCGDDDTYVDVAKHTDWFDKIVFNNF